MIQIFCFGRLLLLLLLLFFKFSKVLYNQPFFDQNLKMLAEIFWK